MLPTLLTALLAAAPATGLTLSTQMGKATTPASTYLDAIEQALVAGQLPVRRLPLLCEGRRECLLAGAQNAKLPGIVALTVAYGKKQTTLDLEALRSSDGTTVSQLTFAVTGRLTEADKAKVKAFGAQVAAALSELKSDAPKVDPPPPDSKLVVREPSKPEEKLELTQPMKEKKSAVPGWAFAGGAVAAGVTSGIFVGLASGTRAELESTPNPSPLTRVEAEALAGKANTEYSVALATGLAAGALATAAIIWLVTE